MTVPDQRIIMGIDPGTNILGFGVILVDGKKTHYIDMGVLDLRKEKDHFEKLKRINREVGELIERYKYEEDTTIVTESKEELKSL